MSATCAELAPLLAARKLALLEATDRAELDAHTAACAACRALESQLDQTLEGARVPRETAPASIGERLRERIAEDRRARAAGEGEPGITISVACTYCHGRIERAEAVYCASCLSPAHRDCLVEHGRCTAPGCGETRVVEARSLAPGKASSEPRRGRRWRRFAPALALAIGGTVAAAAITAKRERPDPPFREEPRAVTGLAPPPPVDSPEVLARTPKRAAEIRKEAADRIANADHEAAETIAREIARDRNEAAMRLVLGDADRKAQKLYEQYRLDLGEHFRDPFVEAERLKNSDGTPKLDFDWSQGWPDNDASRVNVVFSRPFAGHAEVNGCYKSVVFKQLPDPASTIVTHTYSSLYWESGMRGTATAHSYTSFIVEGPMEGVLDCSSYVDGVFTGEFSGAVTNFTYDKLHLAPGVLKSTTRGRIEVRGADGPADSPEVVVHGTCRSEDALRIIRAPEGSAYAKVALRLEACELPPGTYELGERPKVRVFVGGEDR
jgi:hypothetical protein